MKIAIALSLALATSVALASPAYVTDQFKVTVRSGASTQNRIIAMLSSGTQVDVLSQDPKTGYSKVSFGGGREGYILTRQLLDQPVARQQVANLQKEVAVLKSNPDQLQSKLATLTQQYNQLKAEHAQLQTTEQHTKDELTALQRTSANAVRIANERNALREQVAGLTRSNEELKAERRELENSSTQRWFLIGGGVALGGILLGLILPHLRFRRRKDSWGSL